MLLNLFMNIVCNECFIMVFVFFVYHTLVFSNFCDLKIFLLTSLIMFGVVSKKLELSNLLNSKVVLNNDINQDVWDYHTDPYLVTMMTTVP